MATETRKEYTLEIQQALEVFNPANFGFEKYGRGYIKEFPGLGPVAVSRLSWEHAQLMAYSPKPDVTVNALQFLSELQRGVWGLDDIDTVPSNTLAVTEDAGGAVLVAYDPEKGFTPEGWYGFVFGFGSPNHNLVSHMLGVREDLRGKADIGFYLKLLQAHEALKTDHTRMHWTYDPARSVNAHVNFNKLGGSVNTFTIDKYGPLPSRLYGNVPTDRFTLEWNMTNLLVQKHVLAVHNGIHKPRQLEEVAEIIPANPENLPTIAVTSPYQVRFNIPSDIDAFVKIDDGKTAVSWRRDMRTTLRVLLNTIEPSSMETKNQAPNPAMSETVLTSGEYKVTDFVTGMNLQGIRESCYILTRK